MQKVLSLLLAYVFLQVQSFALSGGPDYGTSAGLNVIGTYAGVLIPDDAAAALPNGVPVDITPSAASIGLFSLGVNETGPAVGTAIVFVRGTSFTGNIIGVVDPGDGSVSAIVDAVSTYQIQTQVQTGVDDNGNPIFDIVSSNLFAQGSLDAEIETTTVSSSPFTTVPGATRVNGTALLDLFGEINADGTPNITQTVSYTVDGFKQSDTVSDVTLTFGSSIDTGTGG
jgi:hypothetical protein